MDEQQVKQIAQQVYSENASHREFNVSQTSFHTHNGTDSSRVKQGDIIPSTTAIASIQSLVSETGLIINTLQNVTVLNLHAIAANGLGQKGTITGRAQLGNCYLYYWNGTVTQIPTNGGFYEPFLQSCNSAYLDAANIANVRVQASGDSVFGGYSQGYLAYLADNTNTIVASIQIKKWTGTAIIVDIHLEANWYINWFLSMS